MRRAVLVFAVTTAAAVLGGLWVGSSPARAQSTRAAGTLRVGAFRPGSPIAGDARDQIVEAVARERASARVRDRRAAELKDMPDLTQTDPELGVSGGGDSWCGPVAASNMLMWLAEQGKETLAPAGDTRHTRQLALARELGSGRYMGTTPSGGTGTKDLLNGLHRWMRDTGWLYRSLRYQGWREHPYRFSTGDKIAEPAFIEQALRGGAVALIHAGWYTPSRYGDFYRRHGGHWLTVVGAGIDERGEPAPGVLVVHDPAPYSGSEPARHFVSTRKFETGWLLAEDGAFPAKGYSQLGGGMRIKRDGDIAVLDGAVVLLP